MRAKGLVTHPAGPKSEGSRKPLLAFVGDAPKHLTLPQQSRPLIVTPCTASKKRPATVFARSIIAGNVQDVASDWLRAIGAESPLYPAQELYCGRGFRYAVRAAQLIDADIGVLSAGLGYVRGTAHIPSYDLTLQDRSRDNVRGRVLGKFDPDVWWSMIAAGPYSWSMAEDLRDRPLTLMCLSREYARLVARELGILVDQGLTRLRIFGHDLSAQLPEALHRFLLPYDERIGQAFINGTWNDFAQRAMLHYVSTVGCGKLGDDKGVIAQTLTGYEMKDKTTRNESLSDAEVCALIRELHGKGVRSRSQMLTILRHERHIACEQRRFARLYESVLK